MSCARSGNHYQNCSSCSVIVFSEKGVGRQHTTFTVLPAKMLLVPVSVLSLVGRLYSGGSKFLLSKLICYICHLFHTERSWQAFWFFPVVFVYGFALWCKSIFFDLFWNVKLFIAQAAQAHYMNADVTLACKRCCVTKCVFSALQSWWNPTCERLWALNLDALPHFIGHTPAVADADLQKEK